MAAAQGVRVVGLYAGSNPDRSGPWGNRDFTVNRYPQALKRMLGKSEAEVRFGRRLRSGDAMNEIDAGDVIEMVERAWAMPGENLQA